MNKANNLFFPGEHKFMVHKGIYSNADGMDDMAGPQPAMPLFPDFSAAGCDQLNSYISDYTKSIENEVNPVIQNEYRNAISRIQSALTDNGCKSMTKPVVRQETVKPAAVPAIKTDHKEVHNQALYGVAAVCLVYLLFGT